MNFLKTLNNSNFYLFQHFEMEMQFEVTSDENELRNQMIVEEETQLMNQLF